MSVFELGLSAKLDGADHLRTEKLANRSALFRSLVRVSQFFADLLSSAAGVFLAYRVYYFLDIGKHISYQSYQILIVAAVIGVLTAVLLERDGAYRGSNSLLKVRETGRAIRIPGQTLFLILPVTYLLGRSFSRWVLVISLVTVPFLLLIQKVIMALIIDVVHRKGYGVERVVIYGAGYTGKRVFSTLLHSPVLGMRPVLMVDDDKSLNGTLVHELGYRRTRSLEVRSVAVTPAFLRSCGCEKLIISIPSLSKERFLEISLAAREAGAQVVFLPGDFLQEHYWTESINVDGLLFTSVGVASPGWYYLLAKRALDLLVSVLLLTLLSLVIAMITILIKRDSPGPAFFVQKRVGKNGRLFNMFKFRSMRSDAPKYCKSPDASEDPRITRMGKWLRKSSLDELPQLLNVVRGEMSLVGPRPEMPFIVEKYDLRQRQRLFVTPGITGLWQLSADRAFHIHENIHYDLYYIRHRGFFFDLAILIHTLFFAAKGI